MASSAVEKSAADRRTASAYVLTLIAAYLVSRALYAAAGVRFDAAPLNFYLQYADPYLLRTDLWRTILYFEQQPPVYNLYLGAVLKLWPGHYEIAFHVAQLTLGLALAIGLYALVERAGGNRPVALAIAMAFTLCPTSVLYENILYFEYPVMALLCASALFLHRYATNRRLRDALVFFICLALLGGIRSLYHPAWFAALAACVAYAMGEWKRTLLAAAIPGLFLAVVYGKNLALFHTVVPGAVVYGKSNFAVLAFTGMPTGEFERLSGSGKVSRLWGSGLCAFRADLGHGDLESAVSGIVPRPPATGVEVRDDCTKTTGAGNFNCQFIENIAAQCGADAAAAFHAHPKLYLASIFRNAKRYFHASSDEWPFDGRQDPNKRSISIPLRVENALTNGEMPPLVNHPWLSWIALPSLILFGAVRAGRCIRDLLQSRPVSATEITVAFAASQIVYLSATVILFSLADQNRYRFEVSALYALLLSLWISERWANRRRNIKAAQAG